MPEEELDKAHARIKRAYEILRYSGTKLSVEEMDDPLLMQASKVSEENMLLKFQLYDEKKEQSKQDT
jgi:hypothetical protein